MSFDVGIGKCRSVSRDQVEVWVDSSVVSKVVPDAKWQRAGTSVMKVPVSVCSTERKLQADDEVFLASSRINARSSGLIDYLGSGEFVRVPLAPLVPQVEMRTPPPQSTRKPNWKR